MAVFFRDLRLALRTLSRRRDFFVAAVLTLGLGIGLNTTVFSLVSALLTNPLPVEDSQQLVRVYRYSASDVMTWGPVAWRDLDELREQTRSFQALAGYAYTPLALEHGAHHRLAMGERVSENYFDLLGLSAAQGRLFREDDVGRSVVVLSHRAWRQWFGGEAAVVGGDLRVNGQNHRVIGVTPEGFGGLTRGLSSEVWLPVRWRGGAQPWVIGRLASGVSLESSQSEVALVGQRLDAEFSEPAEESELRALPAEEVRVLPQVDGALTGGSMVALVLVALVLALAAVNVSHLILARSLERQQEVATRRALGASRGSILRLWMAEGTVLSLAGGLVGLLLAIPLVRGLRSLDVPLPVDVVLGPELDLHAVLFTLAISLLLGVGLSLAPGRSLTRLAPAGALAGGPKVSPQKRRSGRLLISLQVALSLVLLLCAALCLQSFWRAQSIDSGFDASGVLVATMAPQLQGYEPAAAENFRQELLERVRSHPSVESAGWTSHLPLTFELHADQVARHDWEGDHWLSVDSAGVGPGYFESLRIPLEEGRAFSAFDDGESPQVAVINRTLAERLWPGEEAIGRSLRLDGLAGTPLQVVGVVSDGKYRTLGESPRPFLYRPLGQGGDRSTGAFVNTGTQTLVVRTTEPEGAWAAELRRLIREIGPEVAVSRLAPLEEVLAIVLWLPRITALAFGAFGLLALALAATGVYGVLSFAVGQRRHELGVRLALGARPMDLHRMVLGEALGLAGLGVVLGVLASMAVTRLLDFLLYGIRPNDGATLGVVSLGLLLVALAAALHPARQAARTSVVESLRADG